MDGRMIWRLCPFLWKEYYRTYCLWWAFDDHSYSTLDRVWRWDIVLDRSSREAEWSGIAMDDLVCPCVVCYCVVIFGNLVPWTRILAPVPVPISASMNAMSIIKVFEKETRLVRATRNTVKIRSTKWYHQTWVNPRHLTPFLHKIFHLNTRCSPISSSSTQPSQQENPS